MAKTKTQLIKEGKELGLNLKSSMSLYELEHRIAEKKAEIEKANGNQKTETKSKKKINGEY